MSAQALRLARETQYFEVDEMARLKRLFKGLRLEGLAKIVGTPLAMIFSRRPRPACSL
jgi:hypothetical protein